MTPWFSHHALDTIGKLGLLWAAWLTCGMAFVGGTVLGLILWGAVLGGVR